MSHLRNRVNAQDHTQGPVAAPLQLVEYGDFQCPACGLAHGAIKALQAALGGSLCFVFRHFPLTQVHEFALTGAMAAEAAGAQDRFWDMHDMLFEHQQLVHPEGVFLAAQRLALDLEKFQADMNREDLRKRIEDDFLGGVYSGVNGTPGLFLNEEQYHGPLDPALFRELLRPGYLEESMPLV